MEGDGATGFHMDAHRLKAEFDGGLEYGPYVTTGNAAQVQRWNAVYAAAALDERQRALVASFSRQMNLLVLSGVWCGDCIEQIPLLQRIVEANRAKLAMRIVDRDLRAELSAQLRINGGGRVPVVGFLAEDFEPCGWFGDRTLSRYRAIAARQIGPACSLGAVVPPAEELSATLADWLAELERVQLMLRLSPRLRERHGD